MITKNDCMSILVRLETKGININPYMKKLIVSNDIPLDVLKFISDNQGIEASNFYEMLRKSHNQKKSPLYTNILREVNSPDEIITTLACLLTQIILYSKKLTDTKDLFIKELRAEEITRALNEYFKNQDISMAVNLLKIVKSDLLVLEYIRGRRELAA